MFFRKRARTAPDPAPAPVASKKPALLFVDHIFHKRTKSFAFLEAIFARGFDVTTVYVDPDAPVAPDALLAHEAEYVVIGQMDFLTPLFIADGRRVVVVQMFDGSAGLPDTHWQMNRQARYLNFSTTLHARALALGCESLLVQYFPDPAGVPVVEDWDSLRGFFWQRVPRAGLDLGTVQTLLAGQLDTLHVHTPADDGTPFDDSALEGFDYPVTQSSWFEKQSGFTDVLNSANVFLAPRYAEGIGHAFLEAMARGMLVIAHDMPTHNEYIQNWRSGVLFGPDTGVIDLTSKPDKVRSMARTARLAMMRGFTAWQRSQPGIVEFIRSTPRAAMIDHAGLRANVEHILSAYQRGSGAYTQALDDFAETRRLLASWRDFEREAGTAPGARALETRSDAHIFLGHGNGAQLNGAGWAAPEMTHRWAIAQEAQLHVPLRADTALTGLAVQVRGIAEGQRLHMALNGTEVTDAPLEIGELYRTLRTTLATPLPVTAANGVTLTLRLDAAAPPHPVDPRPLSFAVKSITVETGALTAAAPQDADAG